MVCIDYLSRVYRKDERNPRSDCKKNPNFLYPASKPEEYAEGVDFRTESANESATTKLKNLLSYIEKQERNLSAKEK